MKRAAVIIGVDWTGGLTPLESAASGARSVARWLKGEGFAVRCLTDEKAPVTAAKVEKAVRAFVTLPVRCHLLVVYFSGHGYWQGAATTGCRAARRWQRRRRSTCAPRSTW